jgi:ABC-type cobalt transport system substrate-binding protein
MAISFFDKDIHLKALFDLVDSCFNNILIKSNPAQQAKLYELKFFAALYTGNDDQRQNVIKQFKKESKNWDMRLFETWYGNIDTWLQNLEKHVIHRSEFLAQIESNKQDKKLSKLKQAELKA